MNLTQSEVEALISEQWLSGKMKSLANDWSQSADIISVLWKMNRLNEHKMAWRSAYLIDLIHDVNPSIIEPYLKEMIALVAKESNQSIKRHYLRILSQHDLNELADGQFIDLCFKWLGNENTPIAVKAHCMTIIHNITHYYPDLISEFILVLEGLLPYGSKGEVNRAKKILIELEKKKV
ncbi:hypothetical protein [Carboxylicivirga linearis]|uniref:Adenylosuccinate lyase n=1 Tax=Carboxylicivirga linearis TaxID=1628157 RepID=A0ABS5JRT2_9BACT|nr:hypothetical protein [Carboxylicivirga linearis]MBS2097538.1 hypothetical protein [Carboxylicivirga linearis]